MSVRYPVIAVSRSHAGDVKNISKTVFGDNSSLLIAAGAGYKVLQIVSNNATAYLHTTKIKKWDICAGNAILKALGGKMTTLKNELIDYSTNTETVNDQGLLASIVNHELYIKKFLSQKYMVR